MRNDPQTAFPHSLRLYPALEAVVEDAATRFAFPEPQQLDASAQPTNVVPHRELVKRMSAAVRRCGYPLILTHSLGLAGTAHQCGTARMGEDPVTSVVDQDCRAHDVENMWIVDASVFPSSGAVNPALTIAANALRVAAGDSWTG